MKIGKLTASQLKHVIFNNIKKKRKEFLNSPGIGDDCAAIDLGEKVCYVSSDPITGAVSEIGKLAVNITCNDLATTGVEPMGIMVTILAPPSTSVEDLQKIMVDMESECTVLNIDILGGHTEITDAVNKIIISVTGLGFGTKDHYEDRKEILEGDIVLLTKGTGIEGTAIIAYEKEEELKVILSQDEINHAKSMMAQTSVVKEGLLSSQLSKGMHDVTEGGILGAIWEVAELSKLGVTVYRDQFNVAEVTHKICDHYKIDPLKLISSGSMLIVVSPKNKDELLDKLISNEIPTFEIGYFTQNIEEKFMYHSEDQRSNISEPESDELYKIV
ncbi:MULTISPECIES: AIR synthase family protein [Psychrilyobacter]|uniref:AIR synthase n=1 Tax=Psychrilyobacter piezotolerans TaxID=2293438 RepID=A0ABX9KEF8_9FUSO|nr:MULTISPECIES: AIR synthase family protein [Psychrilyobacter]MCS5421304.1 AIR synthase family protein [Psychrilyobacter sp. S5]NDI78326.1 AIR synthase [Psychrilyobacter piezotolerans]RDE59673.1 AIR synthase [Psychrilyobacter sp. S5]REI40049.1 AIR synthase [Psychrilyobacter piezotolerans]